MFKKELTGSFRECKKGQFRETIGLYCMDVSENSGSVPPKSSIKKCGFFHDVHHPFWGVSPLIFGNTHMVKNERTW